MTGSSFVVLGRPHHATIQCLCLSAWGLLNLIHLVHTFWLCCFCSNLVIQFLMFHAQRKIILKQKWWQRNIDGNVEKSPCQHPYCCFWRLARRFIKILKDFIRRSAFFQEVISSSVATSTKKLVRLPVCNYSKSKAGWIFLEAVSKILQLVTSKFWHLAGVSWKGAELRSDLYLGFDGAHLVV